MKTNSKVSMIRSVPVWKHSLKFLLLLAVMIMVMKPVMADTVNINKANIETLQQNLQGVGPVKAQAIIDYRKKNGPFKSVNDLKNVSGFGDEIINNNKKNISTSRGLTRADENKERNNTRKVEKSKSVDRDDDGKGKKYDKDSKTRKDKKDKKDKKSKKDKKDKKLKKDKNFKKDKKSKKDKKDKESKKDRKSKKSKKDKKD
ncbi:MAG: helix-hairpin-helix domain-containing protein [Gammaproteobacteria bacterium]|nr:helix-hairpin-helix domain-containing protein [Gammaproteobacteria bacterium]